MLKWLKALLRNPIEGGPKPPEGSCEHCHGTKKCPNYKAGKSCSICKGKESCQMQH